MEVEKSGSDVCMLWYAGNDASSIVLDSLKSADVGAREGEEERITEVKA